MKRKELLPGTVFKYKRTAFNPFDFIWVVAYPHQMTTRYQGAVAGTWAGKDIYYSQGTHSDDREREVDILANSLPGLKDEVVVEADWGEFGY